MINGFVQLDRETVPGAVVRAGQRLFRLLPPTAQTSLKSSDSERDKAEVDRLAAEVNKARTEYNRQRELLRQGAGSTDAAEKARAELVAIEAAAAAAKRAEYVVASAGAAQYEFASPQAGIVLQVLVGRGQYVSMGTPVAHVAALDPLWLRVPVYSGDWNRIARSAPAEVQPLGAGPSSTVRMAKSIVGPPTADAPTSTTDLYYEVPNHGNGLRPGERVNVRLPLAGAHPRLTAARGSVIYDVHGNAWVYEAVSPTEFVRRRVEVDYTTQTAAILTSGPKAGTQVVSVGVSELFGAEFGAK
jgi:RND family efflux transporter MFP subunit